MNSTLRIICLFISFIVAVSCSSGSRSEFADSQTIQAEFPPSAVLPDEGYVNPLAAKKDLITSAFKFSENPKPRIQKPLDGLEFGPKFLTKSGFLRVDQILFSKDGQSIFTLSNAGSEPNLQQRKWPSGEAIYGLKLPNEAGTSPNGPSRIISVVGTENAEYIFAQHSGAASVRLWNASNGKYVSEYGVEEHDVFHILMSPDQSKILFTGFFSQAGLVDRATSVETSFGRGFDGAGKFTTYYLLLQRKLASDDYMDALAQRTTCAAFSPNSEVFALGYADNTVELYSTKTAKLRTTIQIDRIPDSLAFSPSGDRLAIGTRLEMRHGVNERGNYSPKIAGPDSLVLVYNLDTSEEIFRVKAHRNPTRSLAFSGDGSVLATAGILDPYARLWDLATGTEKASFLSNYNGVRAIAFSPDGEQLITSGQDYLLRVHSIASGGPEEDAAHCSFTVCG